MLVQISIFLCKFNSERALKTFNLSFTLRDHERPSNTKNVGQCDDTGHHLNFYIIDFVFEACLSECCNWCMCIMCITCGAHGGQYCGKEAHDDAHSAAHTRDIRSAPVSHGHRGGGGLQIGGTRSVTVTGVEGACT
jgi:hypothetical protein